MDRSRCGAIAADRFTAAVAAVPGAALTAKEAKLLCEVYAAGSGRGVAYLKFCDDVAPSGMYGADAVAVGYAPVAAI